METERPERWRVDGEQLRAGVYALNGEVHIDAVEFCFGMASDRRASTSRPPSRQP
jgi:hypothetical protein